MQKFFVTMLVFVLTIAAQAQRFDWRVTVYGNLSL